MYLFGTLETLGTPSVMAVWRGNGPKAQLLYLTLPRQIPSLLLSVAVGPRHPAHTRQAPSSPPGRGQAYTCLPH